MDQNGVCPSTSHSSAVIKPALRPTLYILRGLRTQVIMAATRVKPTGLWTEWRLECSLSLSASAALMMEAADLPLTSVHVYHTQKTALYKVLELLAYS